VFYTAVKQKQAQVMDKKIIEIEKQIALDLPLLNLSNDLLKHSGNKEAVSNYINVLNLHLNDDSLVLADIMPENELSIILKSSQFKRYLRSINGTILLVFDEDQPYLTRRNILSHILILVLSLIMSVWAKIILFKKNAIDINAQTNDEHVEQAPIALIIDLNNKTLSNSYTPEQQLCLANKPLCFYLALVEFCKSNVDTPLNQNKNIPDELLDLANKYFYRLVELGHTVRKRPNFNNSLEKTLSEIRAALDEVLSDYPDQKEIYYPPKAYGEGSRSRLHSYGLVNISKGNIEIKGK
jgi:hypothetical protein